MGTTKDTSTETTKDTLTVTTKDKPGVNKGYTTRQQRIRLQKQQRIDQGTTKDAPTHGDNKGYTWGYN